MNRAIDMEECVRFLCLKHRSVGMRYTPLHHRQYALCYRLSTVDRNALNDSIQIAKKDGWNVAGPYMKLDGCRYVEIYEK